MASPAKLQEKIANQPSSVQKPIEQKKQITSKIQSPESTQKKMANIVSESAQPRPPVITGFVVQPMTIAQFIDKTGKPLSEVILFLLKKGIVAGRNQIISDEVVAELARHYEIPTTEIAATTIKDQSRFGTILGKPQEARLPVVVVIGHVDHGKTTLLDFIRNTRVAAREKGGITQHLGAYAATTKHGSLVFLDTPGHEAFSLIRTRGVRAADIAILVVAADDGIMPQTIEAIKTAQSANLPMIVALNKIDKATPAQIEKVKQGLAQHGLVPEEWGGQTVIVPISAKLGTGIDELLEIVVLQAQLLELSANIDVPAQGFVLESKIEKGLGLVATVICQQGMLRVGDYFVAGATQGKVSALIDSAGNRLKEVAPSLPVLVAGFEALPRAGDAFEVVSVDVFKKHRHAITSTADVNKYRNATSLVHDNVLSLIIKTDNASSLEALLGAIRKLHGKAFKEFNIIHGAVGPITESDISLAIDTKALIYGLHVKVESNAVVLAQKKGLVIKLFDIIYKMLEDLEIVAEQGRPVKMVTKKIGEAVVLKVFDIKNLGVIAGAQVKSGLFSRNGKVVVFRGKHKVGEGSIKSLQRDKKAVKEVHAGFECAFMIDGFSEWQVDDRVECSLESPE